MHEQLTRPSGTTPAILASIGVVTFLLVVLGSPAPKEDWIAADGQRSVPSASSDRIPVAGAQMQPVGGSSEPESADGPQVAVDAP